MQSLFPNLQSFFVSATDSVRPALSSMSNPLATMFKSRLAMKDRKHAVKVKSSMALNRMARDLDASQPSLAAELRYFASR